MRRQVYGRRFTVRRPSTIESDMIETPQKSLFLLFDFARLWLRYDKTITMNTFYGFPVKSVQVWFKASQSYPSQRWTVYLRPRVSLIPVSLGSLWRSPLFVNLWSWILHYISACTWYNFKFMNETQFVIECLALICSPPKKYPVINKTVKSKRLLHDIFLAGKIKRNRRILETF